jgi:anhydro-N-acetylmuramic acid kinase
MYGIGLMSGTSVDGIDAALVEIQGRDLDLQVRLLVAATFPYPEALRQRILEVAEGAALSMAELAELDDAIAYQFALAARTVQEDNPRANFLGSHGQTVFHRPPEPTPPKNIGYSQQLGRGEVIANLTGIPTVSNFRAADLAALGQGAPLVPKVDACLLSHPQRTRCVQNIGGIGNVTYLPARQGANWLEQVSGWDTGPGNVLLDLAIQKLTKGEQSFDEDGNWAAQGTPYLPLVEQWLEQDFFHLPPPKSTGRELFGKSYLEKCWQDGQKYFLSPSDWLATLTELTAESIVHNYRSFLAQMPQEVLLCGGGSRNLYLKKLLTAKLAPQTRVLTTDEVGLSAEFKEAISFAVLAYWRYCCSFEGNLPSVTGAKHSVLLGDIHLPCPSQLLDG